VKAKAWWTIDDVADGTGAADECTGDKISELHQGALAFSGLGAPHPTLDSEDKPLDCFEGFTTRTLNDLVHQHLEFGYPPEAVNRTGIAKPHEDVVNFALDGVCALAKMVEYMLSKDYPIEDLRTPSEGIYKYMVNYLRNRMVFRGASGDVNIVGNDLPGFLAVWQVDQNTSNLVGIVAPDGDMNLSYASGVRNASWTAAPADAVAAEEESFPILAVVAPVLAIILCGVMCAAVYSSTRGDRRTVTSKNSNQV